MKKSFFFPFHLSFSLSHSKKKNGLFDAIGGGQSRNIFFYFSSLKGRNIKDATLSWVVWNISRTHASPYSDNKRSRAVFENETEINVAGIISRSSTLKHPPLKKKKKNNPKNSTVAASPSNICFKKFVYFPPCWRSRSLLAVVVVVVVVVSSLYKYSIFTVTVLCRMVRDLRFGWLPFRDDNESQVKEKHGS